MNVKKYFHIILFSGILFFSFALRAHAASEGDVLNFNVEKDFDAAASTRIQAQLVKSETNLYFYVPSTWWQAQSEAKKTEVLGKLDDLSVEFNSHIYPILANLYGTEWRPGIDNDNKISVLFEDMHSSEGGYFREADEYAKIQIPISNEREMLYLSLDTIETSEAKIILAHELTHLIIFNQKVKVFGIEENTWLDEGRADYSSTLLGYDDPYQGSNLQSRVKDFVQNPSDSITDWSGTKDDYASVSLFIHYLVEHYGTKVLADSLHINASGITSIDQALAKEGSGESFSDIFTNWTVATLANDCSLGQKYCYLEPSLQNIRVNSTLNFLPLTGNSSLSVSNVAKNWSGNWQKIIGGNGSLALDFSSSGETHFKIPYVVFDKNNDAKVSFLQLDKNGKGHVDVPSFGSQYLAIIVMPSLQRDTSEFEGLELTAPYSFTASISGQTVNETDALVQKLLDQIDSLKNQIALLLGQTPGTEPQLCSQLNNNLFFGLKDNADVKCLQTFLKNQGSAIYPEGYVTGNFGNLTKQAVVRFQEKYASDILAPVGLTSGTGYVGLRTRTKINQLLVLK